MSGPLSGIKVVELGLWIAGPAASGVLGDWGAEIVKVEPLRGDPSRLFRTMLSRNRSDNPIFELDNRNKRGIAVDIGSDHGRRIVVELVQSADVFVTNVRPDSLERAGLDYPSLRDVNPRLVYAQVTGFGLEGPDADRPGFDISAYWARSGMAHLHTPENGTPPIMRGGMGDHPTGLALAGGVAAALFHRERTGEGQMVSTSLYRQGVYTLGYDLSLVSSWGRCAPVTDHATAPSPTANSYRTRDGRRFWVVGVEADRHWPPLARVAGRPDLIDDPRFVTAADRAVNARELVAILDEVFATRDLEEWAEIFAGEPDMFWTPQATPDEVLADPQLRAAGGLVDVPGNNGSTTMIASPIDFHGAPSEQRSHAPRLGQHTREILSEIGYDEPRIDDLVARGVVAVDAVDD
ncbi:MAG: CaiB/BaiF CoA transferase family protein [Ilumatobacteraceae bacterium]